MYNMPQQGQLLAKARNAASWFYWIAGLSIFRAFLNLNSHQTSLSFYSLGFTNLLSGTMAGFIASLVICGVWIVFGYLGGKGKKWVLVTGAVLYALDAVLLLILGIFGSGAFAYVAVAFHGYVIYRLWLGIQACTQLQALQAQNGAWYAGAPQAQGAWPPAPGAPPQQPGAWPPPPGAPQFGAPPAPHGGYPPQAPPPGYPNQPAPYPGYSEPPAPPAGSPAPSEWPQQSAPPPPPSHWPPPAQPPSRPDREA